MGNRASSLWEAEGGVLAPEPAEPGPQALAGTATLKVKQSRMQIQGCHSSAPGQAEFMLLRVGGH